MCVLAVQKYKYIIYGFNALLVFHLKIKMKERKKKKGKNLSLIINTTLSVDKYVYYIIIIYSLFFIFRQISVL